MVMHPAEPTLEAKEVGTLPVPTIASDQDNFKKNRLLSLFNQDTEQLKWLNLGNKILSGYPKEKESSACQSAAKQWHISQVASNLPPFASQDHQQQRVAMQTRYLLHQLRTVATQERSACQRLNNGTFFLRWPPHFFLECLPTCSHFFSRGSHPHLLLQVSSGEAICKLTAGYLSK